MSRVFRSEEVPHRVGCSAVGQVHGEKGVPQWGRSTLSRVVRGGAGSR